jgi:hypothetical protein
MRIFRKTVTAVILFVAGTLLLFSSCGPPPPGAETVNVLDYTYDTMKVLDKFSGDVAGFRTFFTEHMEADRVFEFLRGSRVEIESGYGDIYPGVILRSLPDNNLLLEKGLYVTERRNNEALVSLDGKTWYSTRNDFDRGIDNFKNYYDYELLYRPRERYLHITYNLSSGFNDTRETVFVPPWRRVETIKKGMVFKHPDKNKVNYDLKRRIVYIPPGTVVDPTFRFAGNLMLSEKRGGTIEVDILRDIYLYYKGMRIGISFDNVDWSMKLFSFKLGSLMLVEADKDNHITVLFGLFAEYLE